MRQYTYLIMVLVVVLVFACQKAHADERTPLHVGANMVGTVALYYFLNAAGKAGGHDYGQKDARKNTKEMLILAVPAMLATGLFMEAAQGIERNQKIDMGDVGANALGVALGVSAVFVFDL